MNTRRNVLTMGLAALSFGALAGRSGSASAQTLDTVRSRKLLRVAVSQDFPPFGFVGPDMVNRGYDVDVAELLAKGMGVKLELTPVTSVNRIPYLQTNKVDLVAASLGKTAEREKVIDFSMPYAPFFVGVFGPASIPVSAPADLANKSLSVTRGTIEDIELSKVAPPALTIKRYEDANGTTAAFLSGQTDLIATGNVAAAAILERNPPRKPELKFLMKNTPCYIGVRKGEADMVAAVDAILGKAKADGTLNAIAQKWLHADLPQGL